MWNFQIWHLYDSHNMTYIQERVLSGKNRLKSSTFDLKQKFESNFFADSNFIPIKASKKHYATFHISGNYLNIVYSSPRGVTQTWDITYWTVTYWTEYCFFLIKKLHIRSLLLFQGFQIIGNTLMSLRAYRVIVTQTAKNATPFRH